MNIVFIYKASRSNTKKINKVVAKTSVSGLFKNVNTCESSYAGNSIEISKEQAANNQYIIAVGGDGTLNEVLNGIIQYKQENPLKEQPILGVLPLGTANDFVKSFKFTKGIDALLALIKNKQYEQIDIGKLTCFDAHRTSKITRYFINIADIGFGAHVVHKTTKKKSFLGANVTYTKAILSTFLTYKPQMITTRFDNQPEQKQNALSIIFANGKYFGSGLGIAPHAELNDGKLAITQIKNVSMFDFLRHMKSLKTAKKIDHKEANYFKATQIDISSEDKNAAVEADGEFIGYLPLKVDILPKEISFLMIT